MLATDILREEHRVIQRMLAVLEGVAGSIERGGQPSPAALTKALDFIRGFADACHHGKEEECLFPLLEARGVARQRGPIGIMLLEHEQGRTFVQAVAHALERYEQDDRAAGATIAENLRGYSQMLRSHILKENEVLFPLADRLLSDDDHKGLLEKFELVERKLGEGVHQRYETLVAELEAEIGQSG